MSTGCIIQARNTSTRLPGKVMKVIDFDTGATVLDSVIDRVKKCNYIDEVLLAITENPSDDVLQQVASHHKIECFRGSEKDVLSRFFFAATKYNFDSIVRITSDCPFLDPTIIDGVIKQYFECNADYGSNCIKRTFPHGLDCEIVGYNTLKWMHENTTDMFYREHVTSYVTHHLDEFTTSSYTTDENNSNIRITVDTKEDYLLACILTDLLKPYGSSTDYNTIVHLFKSRPYLYEINENIIQKQNYGSIKDELKAATNLLNLQELYKAAEIIKSSMDYYDN